MKSRLRISFELAASGFIATHIAQEEEIGVAHVVYWVMLICQYLGSIPLA